MATAALAPHDTLPDWNCALQPWKSRGADEFCHCGVADLAVSASSTDSCAWAQ